MATELEGVHAALSALSAKFDAEVVIRAACFRSLRARADGHTDRAQVDDMAARVGNGPWFRVLGHGDSAVAELLSVVRAGDGLACREEPVRGHWDLGGEVLPPTDDLARAEIGAGGRAWLSVDERIATRLGTAVTQRHSTAWAMARAVAAEPESDAVLGPTATLSLMASVADHLRAGHSQLRPGRTTVAPRTVALSCEPGSIAGVDAEGTPRRYQPLIARGCLVGLLSDRASAADAGLSRSSGSAWAGPMGVSVRADRLVLACDPRGPSLDELGGGASVVDEPITWTQPLSALRRIRQIGAEARAVSMDRDGAPVLGRMPCLWLRGR